MGYPRAPMPDADMPFNVTMFTGDDQRIDHVIAKGMDQLVMRAAFQKACTLYPDRIIRLRAGVRVIEEMLRSPFQR